MMHKETVDYRALVARLEADSPDAWEEFHALVRRFRHIVAGTVSPADVEDCLQEAHLGLVQAIRERRMQNTACLPGYIETTIRRFAYRYVKAQIKRRTRLAYLEPATLSTIRDQREPSPESRLLEHERLAIQEKARNRLSARDREILNRFYVMEQPLEEICREMHITKGQFTNRKYHAKKLAADWMRVYTKVGTRQALLRLAGSIAQ